MAWYVYISAKKNDVQNIVEKDLGKARLSRDATAGTNFVKPGIPARRDALPDKK